MRLLRSITRWPARWPASRPDSCLARIEVCPPSLVQPPAAGFDRVLFWLLTPRTGRTAPPSALPAAREDFLRALADVDHPDAAQALRRVHEARSLRDLWHLRTVLHRLVAVACNEAEAGVRLQRLNRHFPTRLPRAGAPSLRRAA